MKKKNKISEMVNNNVLFNSKQLELLFELLHTNSPSGFECQVVECLNKYMLEYCDMTTDVIGNLYMKVGNEEGLRVMISAHSDEVGMQVIHIDRAGFVYARNVASIDKQTIPGSTVVALTQYGEIKGVIGKKSPHVLDGKDKELCPNLCDLWIDFGFESDKEAKEYINCGDYITLDSEPRITPNGKKIISKALDNKIGIFILAEVVKEVSQLNLPISIIGVATAQEEVGYRGGIVAANKIMPDVAICLDVGIATDIPNMSKQHYGELELGKGVGIIQNTNSNEILVRTLVETAKVNNVPIQKTIGHRPSGGTEASLIQLSNGGVATVNISIPNRYMHSLVEMCDLRDVKFAIDLLVAEIKLLSKMSRVDFNLFSINNKNKGHYEIYNDSVKAY